MVAGPKMWAHLAKCDEPYADLCNHSRIDNDLEHVKGQRGAVGQYGQHNSGEPVPDRDWGVSWVTRLSRKGTSTPAPQSRPAPTRTGASLPMSMNNVRESGHAQIEVDVKGAEDESVGDALYSL